jgi:CheY-like chemotaxis protein
LLPIRHKANDGDFSWLDEPKRLKTILVVDSDLGFVAFLSKSLSEAGYAALPATTSQTALPLLKELENPKVDLLMVNFAIPSTADLARTLKGRNQSLKIAAIEDPRRSAISNIPVDASLRRPSPEELAAGDQWLSSVKELLADKSG